MSKYENILSFPGLGIGEFRVNEIAFTVFGHPIMWYGVIITCGMILSFLYVYYLSRFEKVSLDDLLDYAIYTVIFGIFGARLYYVLARFDYFIGDSFGETLYNMIAIWQGGLAIYGGIIGGVLTILVISKIKKIRMPRALDLFSPGVIIGQTIGRWGNFMNAEAFGSQTSLPWRMGIRNLDYINTIYVHPTFLYESLWNLLGFLLIHFFYKKKKYDGQVFLFYITWYGFGRMLIEGLRTDSLMIFGIFRVSQVLGLCCFLVGTVLLITFAVKPPKKHHH